MRISIEDHILKQDAKLKELKADIETLKELDSRQFRYHLFIEDEYDSKIFTTPMYSFATSVTIREDARSWEIVSAISYHFDLELKSGKQRVYCREENWRDQDMRVAIVKITDVKTTDVKASHGYGYIYDYVRHGPAVEDLKGYYTAKGVKKELVEEMEKLVNESRANNPIRSSWAA